MKKFGLRIAGCGFAALFALLVTGCLETFTGGGDEAALAAGPTISQVVKLGDGKLLGIEIPAAVQQQGRSMSDAYIRAKYPAAAPWADGVLNQIFPASKGTGGTLAGYEIETRYQVVNADGTTIDVPGSAQVIAIDVPKPKPLPEPRVRVLKAADIDHGQAVTNQAATPSAPIDAVEAQIEAELEAEMASQPVPLN